MTSAVNALTTAIISSYPFDTLSNTIGIVVIELLVGLLVQKELFRVMGRRPKGGWKVLEAAIAPLLLAFGLNIVVRLLSLI